MRHQQTSHLSLRTLVVFFAMIALTLTGCEEDSGGDGFVPTTGGEGGSGTADEAGEEGGVANFGVTEKFSTIISSSCSCFAVWADDPDLAAPGSADPPTQEECEEQASAQLSKSFYIEDPNCISELSASNAEVKGVFDCVEGFLDETIACLDAAACVDPGTVQGCKNIDQAMECLPEDELKDLLSDECGFTGGNQAEEEFDCGDDGNTVVKAFKVCDGEAQCPNGADEADCGVAGFECADGSEIPQGDLCNGVDDCPDGSDEVEELCGG